jgi:hypothetical protein
MLAKGAYLPVSLTHLARAADSFTAFTVVPGPTGIEALLQLFWLLI